MRVLGGGSGSPLVSSSELALCGISIVVATQAAEMDYFGPPPDNDVSAQTGPYIGLTYADNALVACINGVPNSPPGCTVGLIPGNEGSFLLQGGVQGDLHSVGINNSVPAPGQSNGGINVPTNKKPSPGVAGSGSCFDNNGVLWPEGDLSRHLRPAVHPAAAALRGVRPRADRHRSRHTSPDRWSLPDAHGLPARAGARRPWRHSWRCPGSGRSPRG